MELAFRRLLVAAFRHRRATLAIMAVIGIAAAAGVTSVSFNSNVLDLLPQRAPTFQAFRTYLDDFGSLDRLFVSIQAPDGHTIAEYDHAIAGYLTRLRALPDLHDVHGGANEPGRDWSYLLDRRLLLLDPPATREALARLERPALGAALAEARDRLTIPSADMRELVQNDPLGWLVLLRDRLRSEGLPLGWSGDGRGYVSADGRSRLIIAQPVAPPQNVDFSRRLNASLDAIAAETLAQPKDEAGDPLPPLTIEEGGGYRIAPEVEALVRTESIRNGVASFVTVTLLVVLVFRSARPLLLVAAPIVLASLVTIVVCGLFEPLSTAASGSAAMLFGLGVDGTLLLYIAYLTGRRRGQDAEGAVAGLAPPAVSLTIGFTTTAATFLGLALLDFPALAGLGRIVGIGILLCGVFTLAMVPALAPPHPTPNQLRRLEARWLPALVSRRRRLIVAAAGLMTVVCAIAAPALRLVPTLDRLKTDTPGEEADARLAQRFGLPADTMIVLATGPDLDPLVDAHSRLEGALQDAPAVPVSAVSALLPPRARQEAVAALAADARASLGALPDRIAQAADAAGFRPGTFDAFAARLPVLLDPAQRLTLDGYNAHGLADFLGQFVQRSGDEYATVTYVYPRSDAERARVGEVVARLGAPLRLTGVGPVNAELAQRFWPSFLSGAAIGTVAVVLIVIVAFRDPRVVALALVPTALSLLWAAGLLALFRVELDLFSVFALLMSVGISVDYGVHVLHRTLRAGADGLSIALIEMAPAILLAGASTILGFGSLAFSSYRPLRLLGLVTTLTVAGSLVASLLVLPAIVMGRRR